jgi:hypothetical protein
LSSFAFHDGKSEIGNSHLEMNSRFEKSAAVQGHAETDRIFENPVNERAGRYPEIVRKDMIIP